MESATEQIASDELTGQYTKEQAEGVPYNEIVPPEGDPNVGKVLFGIIADGVQWKEDMGYYEKWSMYEDMGRNIHYEEDEDTAGVPLTSMNLLYKHRKKKLDLVYANNPTYNAKAVGMVDEAGKQKLMLIERAAEHHWREQNLKDVHKNVIGWFGATDGTYLGKAWFDQEAEGGAGEIAVDGIDPRYFIGYPFDEPRLQSLDIAIHLKPMTVTAARRRYSQFASVIKADEEIINKVETERERFSSKSATDFRYEHGGTVWDNLGMGSGAGGDKKTLIAECWIKDYSGRYSGNLRMVTLCSCGEVVLEDTDNPNVNKNFPPEWKKILYLNDKFPFFKAQSNPDPVNFFGGSDFDHLVETNKDLDEALTFMNMIGEASTSLIFTNPKDSGVQDSELEGKGNKVVRPHTAMHGQGLGYVNPPLIPPALPALVELSKRNFYELSDSFNIDQAQLSGNKVVAAKAIGMLTEMENRSASGEQMAAEHCIVESGRMVASLMQSHYIDDRLISYMEEGEEQQGVINAEAIAIPVKITIVPGSTMPVSKLADQEKTLGLYEKGMVPLEYALRKLEVEGWREVAAQMKEGPVGEFMQKLSAILPVPEETLQAVAEIMRMDPKEFKKAMEAGKIGKIEIPQQGQDAAEEKGKTLEQNKIAIDNALNLIKQDEIRAKIRKIDKEIEKVDAEIRKIAADTEKTNTDKEVAVEGAKRDKEQLEIERAKAVKEISTPPKAEKYGDKNTAGYRERGISSNNKEV